MSGAAAMSTPHNPNRTHITELILAWAFVGIPLLWGVLQTLRNAMKLFQ